MTSHRKRSGRDRAIERRRSDGDRIVPGSENVEIPVGFEMLLYRAAQRPEDKRQLIADREQAAAQWGIPLRASERATLAAVSDAALGAMIDRIQPNNPQRRRFMGNIAAAVTSLAAGTVALGAAAGCDDESSGTATATTTTTPTATSGGAGIGPGGTTTTT
ncbi:MAG: hypothetical protein JRI23_05865, partial [Deltaproteobacteria bacterium]|nr:hypothetical protein [Deltaproteobacteria bacterium]MBW2531089.1 hypothetical protein [Deltaproteobacteria bacterium]